MKKMLAVALIVLVGLFMLSVPSVMAGPLEGIPCNGNFDRDDDVDGLELTEFLIHFGRGSYNDPCPFSSTVPKTGVTISDATGDDGDLQKGVAWPTPRFTANVDNNGDHDCNDALETCDGTVTDNLTGLIWLKDANCFGTSTWPDALTDCNGLADGECDLVDGSTAGDWRLPNRNELLSLMDVSQSSPLLPFGHPFINVQSTPNEEYWSSTRSSSINAWVVDMLDGTVAFNGEGNANLVWPVRDPL